MTERPDSEQGSDGEQRPLAGRRTLGPAPSPGSRYSIIVGLLFAAIVAVATINTVTSRDTGTLGIDEQTADLPLPEFAVPVADSDREGDANVAQDDCETSELPCPEEDRRVPACEVDGADVIRVCDYFDKPLVISFWFTRGGDCEAQQDVVSAVSQRYGERVNFLSINIRDDRDKVRELIRERGWTMPVGYDQDGAVSNVFRVGGCPTFSYAYPGGILHDASGGELSATELDGRVRELVEASRERAATDR